MLNKNFRNANATARLIFDTAEMLRDDMANAETEDDLFAIKVRAEQMQRSLARLIEINNASLEGRAFEDEAA